MHFCSGSVMYFCSGVDNGTIAEADQPLNADEQETLAVLEERLLRRTKANTNTLDDLEGKRGES